MEGGRFREGVVKKKDKENEKKEGRERRMKVRDSMEGNQKGRKGFKDGVE